MVGHDGAQPNKYHRSSSCRITTTNDETFHASACIVTLPIGVLKQSIENTEQRSPTFIDKARSTSTSKTPGVSFDPPLPTWKQSAIDRAGLAILNTLVVQWNQPICNEGVSAMYLIHSSSSSATNSDNAANPLAHGFVCPDAIRRRATSNDIPAEDTNKQPPFITQFYISGEYDANGHKYPFDDIEYWKKHALDVVKESMSCSDDNSNNEKLKLRERLTVNNIVSAQITKWHLDPDFYGSYSAPVKGTRSNEDRQNIAKPIDDVVYFAGEHTNIQGRYQTIDGAYDTGIVAAKQILSSFNSTSRT